MTTPGAYALAFAAAFAVALLLSYLLTRMRQPPGLRSIPAFEKLSNAMADSAEDGRPVHLALGTAGLADADAMQTVAGLTTLDYLSEQAVVPSNAPQVTTGNPVTLVAAQDVASRPFREREHLAQFDPLSVRFAGGSVDLSAAYAAAVMHVLDRRSVSASIAVGQFGDEYLLIGEAAARNAATEVAGTANLTGLSVMALTTPLLLMGEEMFVAGAYLTRQPWHLASLFTQDTARWIIAVSVVAVVTMKTLRLI